MKAPPFYLGQRVRFRDTAFKENTGTVIAYYPREAYPYAVEVKHRDTDGTFVYEQYGFRASEMIAAPARKQPGAMVQLALREGGAE